jgi:integrase
MARSVNLDDMARLAAFRPPKTASGKRTIAIPEVLSNLLAPLITDRPKNESLFLTENGALMRPSNFRRRIWKPAVEAAELGQVPFHALRHTSVAWAIESGGHMRLIQQRLGHSNIQTTMGTYAHLVDNLDGDLAKQLGNSIKIPDVPQPLPERCKHHSTTVSSPGRWPSDFKAFSSVGDTGIEPVTSCVSCMFWHFG